MAMSLMGQSTYLVLCDQTGNGMISWIVFALYYKEEFQWPPIK
jgi:hypothetical protein